MGTTLTLIDLAGAVSLLLWGVHMVHTSIQRAFRAGLRRVLGVTLGGGAKAFAAAGLMELASALAAMLGTNVGTTLIVQALSFEFCVPVRQETGMVAGSGFREHPK